MLQHESSVKSCFSCSNQFNNTLRYRALRATEFFHKIVTEEELKS